MITKKVAVLCALGIVHVSLVSIVGGEEPAVSLSEMLVLKLASADLTSEPHPFPDRALSSFGWWMSEGVLLKSAERKLWRVTTVRQPGQFDFIHAETEGFTVRQCPWIVLLGFKPAAPQWRDDLPGTIREFLVANVLGSWDRVAIDPPSTIHDTLLVRSTGGFSHLGGTSYDSFIAVVIGDVVWIGLSKRRANDRMIPFCATLDQNSRWFSTAGVRP